MLENNVKNVKILRGLILKVLLYKIRSNRRHTKIMATKNRIE
jgi:hypothetical protein